MRVFGEFWATYYNYYKNAQDEEVYDLTIVNCSYTVKDGDTWKSIADKYNVKVKRLKKMNPLYSPWKLRPNMKVTVKIPPQYTFKDIYSFS